MNGSNFGVAVKEWRFKILRNCVLIMTAFMAFGQAECGIDTRNSHASRWRDRRLLGSREGRAERLCSSCTRAGRIASYR